ncbi:hypothetical protein [Nonomuraea sp. NPDC050202]|uniref:hypothetical protein n=1 Tax=Nonomuraea sp. NPDC050202 TaxID=3155035 RepID=UPI0034064692
MADSYEQALDFACASFVVDDLGIRSRDTIDRLLAQVRAVRDEELEQLREAARIVVENRWYERLAQAEKSLERLARVEAALATLRDARAAWEAEYQHYHERAQRKGYSHDEAAAEAYARAIGDIDRALATLNDPDEGNGGRG